MPAAACTSDSSSVSRSSTLPALLVLRVDDAIVVGLESIDAEWRRSRDVGHLSHGIGIGCEHADGRLATLVVCDQAAISLAVTVSPSTEISSTSPF